MRIEQWSVGDESESLYIPERECSAMQPGSFSFRRIESLSLYIYISCTIDTMIRHRGDACCCCCCSGLKQLQQSRPWWILYGNSTVFLFIAGSESGDTFCEDRGSISTRGMMTNGERRNVAGALSNKSRAGAIYDLFLLCLKKLKKRVPRIYSQQQKVYSSRRKIEIPRIVELCVDLIYIYIDIYYI